MDEMAKREINSDQFTDTAVALLAEANRAASRLRHEYIGTEHVLLSLTEGNVDEEPRKAAAMSVRGNRDGMPQPNGEPPRTEADRGRVSREPTFHGVQGGATWTKSFSSS